MELSASRVPALVYRALLLPRLETQRPVVEDVSRPLSQSAGSGRKRRESYCCRYGHAVRQDNGKRGTRGFDAHKRVKGRKRAILVDTSGLLLSCRVEPASLQDRSLAYGLLAGLKPLWPKLACVFADAGFQSEPLAQRLEEHCGWRLEIVRRSVPRFAVSGFAVQPKRWVVERTFAWLSRNRRLSKDYEQKVQSSEAWMWIAMLRLVLRRLGEHAS